MSDEHTRWQHDSLEYSSLQDNDSMLLPHDRVGNDFSWLQGKSQEDSSVQKVDELEDEESFLYGSEASTLVGEHTRNLQKTVCPALGSQQGHQSNCLFSGFRDVLCPKQPFQIDSMECEKNKIISKNLGTSSEIGEGMAEMQGHKVGKEQSSALFSSNTTAASFALPALSNPNVRQALESLQSLIKGENSLSNETVNLTIILLLFCQKIDIQLYSVYRSKCTDQSYCCLRMAMVIV